MFCPPSKIGSAMFGANDHAAVPALNRPPSVGLAVPNAVGRRAVGLRRAQPVAGRRALRGQRAREPLGVGGGGVEIDQFENEHGYTSPEERWPMSSV
ncbi:Uncharacterised protein [Burkholderia pseudomallei]|nr:Uncharacterised protein [Burkholderia pseudomallei]